METSVVNVFIEVYWETLVATMLVILASWSISLVFIPVISVWIVEITKSCEVFFC